MNNNTARQINNLPEVHIDNEEAHYESIPADNTLDPYMDLGPVMPGCVVTGEYIGHGNDTYTDSVMILEPIQHTLRTRIAEAWSAFKAIFC